MTKEKKKQTTYPRCCWCWCWNQSHRTQKTADYCLTGRSRQSRQSSCWAAPVGSDDDANRIKGIRRAMAIEIRFSADIGSRGHVKTRLVAHLRAIEWFDGTRIRRWSREGGRRRRSNEISRCRESARGRCGRKETTKGPRIGQMLGEVKKINTGKESLRSRPGATESRSRNR